MDVSKEGMWPGVSLCLETSATCLGGGRMELKSWLHCLLAAVRLYLGECFSLAASFFPGSCWEKEVEQCARRWVDVGFCAPPPQSAHGPQAKCPEEPPRVGADTRALWGAHCGSRGWRIQLMEPMRADGLRPPLGPKEWETEAPTKDPWELHLVMTPRSPVTSQRLHMTTESQR